MELEMWAHRNPQMGTWKRWGLGHTIRNYKCVSLEYATSKIHLFGILELTQESFWKSAHLSQRCVSRKEVSECVSFHISECVPGRKLLHKAFTIETICLYTTTILARSSSCPSQEECHQAPPKAQMLPLQFRWRKLPSFATSRSLIVYRISVHSSMAFLLLTVLADQLDE